MKPNIFGEIITEHNNDNNNNDNNNNNFVNSTRKIYFTNLAKI